MRNVMSNQAQRHCYEAGREARSLDKDKTPPGGLGAQRRSWWLAGYNDRDIELQIQAEKQRQTYRDRFPEMMEIWGSVQTSQAPYDAQRYRKD